MFFQMKFVIIVISRNSRIKRIKLELAQKMMTMTMVLAPRLS